MKKWTAPHLWIAVFAAALLLSLAVLPAVAHAANANPNPNTDFCQGLIQQNTAEGALGNVASLISTSFLIIGVMLTIIALAFGLGYAFKIEKLMNFSKMEFGEIIITVIIIAVFVGAAGATPLIKTAPDQTNNIFTNDCVYLSSSSVYAFDTILSDFIARSYGLELLSNLEIHLAPLNFGIDFSPLKGYDLVQKTLALSIDIAALFGGLFLGLAVFLAVIYMLFPLFLYIGIVLRTVPFTRAAGGAFLGFFIGFYVLFPLMLSMLLSAQNNPLNQQAQGATQHGISSFLPALGPVGSLASLPFVQNLAASIIPLGTLEDFIHVVVVPLLYAVFVVIISAMVALQFSEAVGDLLGAESLATGRTFRKIL